LVVFPLLAAQAAWVALWSFATLCVYYVMYPDPNQVKTLSLWISQAPHHTLTTSHTRTRPRSRPRT
jgi:hypothetical protein